ncbi:MAG TPA: VWA domain-containing protein [Blastocatellia bacterium]|nr:VWA domain-containing protein [Blastocatellia bacterium]
MLVYRLLLLIVSSFVYLPLPDSALAQTLSQSVQAPSSKPSVILHVLVTDVQNRPVSILSQDDFQVAEEGVPQTIAFFSKNELPINYVLAIDISGSLKDRISEIMTAAKIIVNGNKPGDETFLIAFRDQAEALLPTFTSNKEALFTELDQAARWAGGQTALNDAIYLALDPFADYKKSHPDSDRRYALILMSDGEDGGSYYNEKDLFKRLRKEGVQVFVIGLSNYPDKKGKLMDKGKRERAAIYLTRLAKETGGHIFLPQSASDLLNAANDITSYLRTQYVIGYNPTVKSSKGSNRKVTVKLVNKPGQEEYRIHSREGYESIQN